MVCWVLYDTVQYEKNKWFADRLVEESSMYYETKLIITEDLRFGTCGGSYIWEYQGSVITPPDVAVSRTIYYLLSVTLERSGVRVYNSSEVSRICNDKALTYIYTCASGIPSIDTWVRDKRFGIMPGDGEYPRIVKSSIGHGGSEVMLASNDVEFGEAVDKIHGDGFVEQPLCTPAGRDVRVYVMGGEIVAAALRVSDKFKSNYSLGGHAEKYELRAEDVELVRKVIKAVPAEMDFVGIDFLVCDERLIFNEIEDVVGTRMMYELYDMDAAEMYMRYVASKEGI